MKLEEIIKRAKAFSNLSVDNHYAANAQQVTLRKYIKALEACLNNIKTIENADDYSHFCDVIAQILENE